MLFISPFFDEDAFPTCEEQSATVMQNDNPQGMIKVQFPWQKKKGLTTPWLRVVTPYAGKGKGMHIIPEVGEEVIIGFDNGNAERPFVFGAMFNGKASAGTGGAGNHVKGLQTASGNRIIFNDKDGSVFVRNGNGCGSITIDSAGNIYVDSCENIYLNAGKNIELTAKKEIKLKATENIKLNATQNIMLDADVNVDTHAKNRAQMIGDGLADIYSKNVAALRGNMATNIFASDGKTTITGTEVDIN